MLTKLYIKNFKRFREETIELGNPVVFVGPNDSGKTSALQALALWELGLRRWNEKRKGKPAPEKRPGVTINRKDLVFIPIRDAIQIWRNLAVRNVQRSSQGQRTKNIRIEIIVEGVSKGKVWKCGLEFDYANEESFYGRPLRVAEEDRSQTMEIPEEASDVRIAYLPPMSGLASIESRLDPGAINVLIGEGRTAEVLRNLCFKIISNKKTGEEDWRAFYECLNNLFGVQLDEPKYIQERGEISMSYKDRAGIRLDIGCSGKGMQQTMLLFAYLASNPGSLLLLDEPDAHLEMLRQRQIYQQLTEWADKHDGQIIIASHSEIILNEAADRDLVIAFLGRAHRIDDRGSQVLKSLEKIGFDDYYKAEQKGWVLYLEGSCDLVILQSIANVLQHRASTVLERPFVEYVGNQPEKAYFHFYGLKEAKTDLLGIAIFDHLGRHFEEKPALKQFMWKKNEIENYLCQRQTLKRWAEAFGSKNFGSIFQAAALEAMDESIEDIEKALKVLDKSPWSNEIKASDEFLKPLFNKFFERIKLPNLMQKSSYYELAKFISPEDIDTEMKHVLDAILEVSQSASPVNEEE